MNEQPPLSPGDPEELQPFFTFDEAQTIDKVINQYNIENGCSPVTLSEFPALNSILARYPKLTHYKGIPIFPGVGYLGSPYGQQATLHSALARHRDRIALEQAIEDQQLLLEQEHFPEALEAWRAIKLTLKKLDEMIAQIPPPWEVITSWFDALGNVHFEPRDEVDTFDIEKAFKYEPEVPALNYEDKSPGFEARLKNSEGKPPMYLINTIFLEGIARVLAHGSEKYGPNMWRDDPMPHSAEIDSMLRHLVAFANGEDVDPDTGELHLFNIGCRLSFLCERYYTRPDLDDRYKPFGQIGPTDLDRYNHLPIRGDFE